MPASQSGKAGESPAFYASLASQRRPQVTRHLQATKPINYGVAPSHSVPWQDTLSIGPPSMRSFNQLVSFTPLASTV
jgi:hypothetical protein